jgi:hypothetical protein
MEVITTMLVEEKNIRRRLSFLAIFVRRTIIPIYA